MIEKELIKVHNFLFEYFMKYKKKHPKFTFLTRMQNNQGRLDKGYLFQGNENYIFVPLYRIGDSYNKTKTIGFVFTETRQYIEIVFNKIEGVTDRDISFHQELVEYLKTTNSFEVQQKNDRQYFFIFKEHTLKLNLDFFLDSFYKKSYELLSKYELLNKYIIDDEKFNRNIKRIEEIKDKRQLRDNEKMSKTISSDIKNIILYGSPGVGKTHNTEKLISLIESGAQEKDIFNNIKNNEQNNGVDIDDIQDRIKFITFHQSFGYEDFIEGFRPNDEGNIERQDGVFKLICEEAQKNLDDSKKTEVDINEELKFKELFELFKDYIQDEIDINQKFPINETAYITNIEENAFRYQGDNWGNTQRMKFDDIKLLYSKSISERKDIKQVHDISGLAKQHATYFSYFMKQLLMFESEQDVEVDAVEKVEQKNYYLVIDEINRGNISKIFGELITLIEEDKRDKLEVTLPYSKKPFKIPSNLYIIGTMNSTDKSIALIDIALRRRFTFIKMMPNSDLVPEIARDLFIELNEEITKKLGEDYQIGHSYFMNIKYDDDLEFVLDYKIKPLLEEYFYGDEEGYKKMMVIMDNGNNIADENIEE